LVSEVVGRKLPAILIGIKLRQFGSHPGIATARKISIVAGRIKAGFTKVEKPAVSGTFHRTKALYYAEFVDNVKFLDP
jgi:hypothetical protein